MSRKIQTPGEYRISGSSVDLYLRDFLYPQGLIQGQPVRLDFSDDRLARVMSLIRNADRRSAFALEPQLIGGATGNVAPGSRLAFASQRFHRKSSMRSSPSRIIASTSTSGSTRAGFFRAAFQNLKGGTVVQGGSTITQQLAKNLYYTQQRTYVRKLKEAFAALILEMKYSKQDILESYLNEIYLGQSGSVAIYGIGQAAQYYFGKSLSQLTVPEAALLAGMIKGPNTYAPVRDPKRAKHRRDLVLLRMKQEGRISDKQYQIAVNSPIRVTTLQHGVDDAPVLYGLHSFANRRFLGQRADWSALFTTLDLEMQRRAEERSLPAYRAWNPNIDFSKDARSFTRRAGRHRPDDRRHPCDGRWTRLPHQSIQSCRSSQTPSRILIQAIRLSYGVRESALGKRDGHYTGQP